MPNPGKSILLFKNQLQVILNYKTFVTWLSYLSRQMTHFSFTVVAVRTSGDIQTIDFFYEISVAEI